MAKVSRTVMPTAAAKAGQRRRSDERLLAEGAEPAWMEFMNQLEEDEVAALQGLMSAQDPEFLQMLVDLLPEYMQQYPLDVALGKMEAFRGNTTWFEKLTERLLSVSEPTSSREGVLAWLARQEGGAQIDKLAMAYGRNLHDYDPAGSSERFAKVSPDRLQQALTHGALISTAADAPQQVMGKLAEMPPGPIFDTVVQTIVDNQPLEDIPSMIPHALRMKDTEAQMAVFKKVIGAWPAEQRPELEAWLNTQPEALRTALKNLTEDEAAAQSQPLKAGYSEP